MNLISMAIVSIAAIVALLPAEVRAEAPTTRNSSCVSRNIVMRPIEDPQVATTVKGRIVKIEYGKQHRVTAKNMVMWLRLKTATGQEVPIYLGSSWYLDRHHLQLQPGDLLEIQAVKPIGAKPSAMMVASYVKKGDRVWTVSIPKRKSATVAKSCQE